MNTANVSRSLEINNYLLPIQGTTAAEFSLIWESQRNNAATRMTVMKLGDGLQYATALSFGDSPPSRSRYLKPAAIPDCQLMTDDRSENHGAVKDFVASSTHPVIEHIIAQKDIEYSNSMVEAAHKNLKYRFLYHRSMPDFKSLCNSGYPDGLL